MRTIIPKRAEVKFHKDIHLPAKLRDAALSAVVRTNGRYTLTKHAEERLRGVEFGWGVTLPERIPFQQAEVIEVTTTDDGVFEKALLRFPSGDSLHDLCVSFTKDGKLATVYVNEAKDAHRTLRHDVYARAA